MRVLPTQDHEPILLTYRELAEKIKFSYVQVRSWAANGRLNGCGLCYVMGEPRVDWVIFQRTAIASNRTHKRGGRQKRSKVTVR